MKRAMIKLENIRFLINGKGNITIGRIGPIHCAAVAGDEGQQLAALVRNPGESLEDLLERLDAAIEKALEEDEYIDEING